MAFPRARAPPPAWLPRALLCTSVFAWPPEDTEFPEQLAPAAGMARSIVGDQSITELGALALVNATRLHSDPHSSEAAKAGSWGRGRWTRQRGLGLSLPIRKACDAPCLWLLEAP